MKLYICPICGDALKDIYVFDGLPDYVVYNKDEWCENCDCEIIPLATPQEISETCYSTWGDI